MEIDGWMDRQTNGRRTDGWMDGWMDCLLVGGWLVGWLVGCVRLNGPLRQYFSLYRAVSQREGERKERR